MAALNLQLRPSTIRINRKGDKGSTQLIFLEGTQLIVGEMSRKIENKFEEFRFIV